VIALRETATEQQQELVSAYTEALTAYHRRGFEHAAETLRGILQWMPDDRPSQMLLVECEAFAASPPDDTWDGVFKQGAK